jgi:glycerophosphoryl diester phosphodiesterase
MSDVTARPLKRIGHKGADHIAPGNTRESFDAALREGVDMVEFDVLPERPDGSGRLVLAHDFEDAARRDVLTLEEGLEHFAQDAWAGIDLDLDLKMPGYEERVVHALDRYRLTARTLVSTMETSSLRMVRALEPALRLGWSVPKVRRNYLSHPLTRAPALGIAQYVKRMLPARAAREIRAGRIDALMSHWALVTPALMRSIGAVGGELYVWTVDDPRRIAALERMGVTGVITNDPRLFVSSSGKGKREPPNGVAPGELEPPDDVTV